MKRAAAQDGGEREKKQKSDAQSNDFNFDLTGDAGDWGAGGSDLTFGDFGSADTNGISEPSSTVMIEALAAQIKVLEEAASEKTKAAALKAYDEILAGKSKSEPAAAAAAAAPESKSEIDFGMGGDSSAAFGGAAAPGLADAFGGEFTFDSSADGNPFGGGDAAGFSWGMPDSGTALAAEPEPENAAAEFAGKAASSGTEDDEVVAQIALCKLFQFYSAEAVEGVEGKKEGFNEICKGGLDILVYGDEGKSKGRMVVRDERTKMLRMNAPVFADMKLKMQSKKFVSFISNNLEGNLTPFLIKFKDEATAKSVHKNIEEVLARLGKPFTKTN